MRCRNLVKESRKIMGNCFEVIKNNGEGGAASSVTQAACNNSAMEREISSSDRSLRILCLHGWRTNGEILSMQMAALQANTRMKCTFIDAPFPGRGEPDKGIAFFYPNRPYYEWFYRAKKDSSGTSPAVAAPSAASSIYENLGESMKYLEDHLASNGPYDGILGFSQGASMATRLALLQQKRIADIAAIDDSSKSKFRFVILIGGVPPQVPFLHSCNVFYFVLLTNVTYICVSL